jgi:hypothetical protein
MNLCVLRASAVCYSPSTNPHESEFRFVFIRAYSRVYISLCRLRRCSEKYLQ